MSEEISRAGGVVTTDAWWVGQSGPAGLYLSDAPIDWIDEVANGETPAAPQRRSMQTAGTSDSAVATRGGTMRVSSQVGGPMVSAAQFRARVHARPRPDVRGWQRLGAKLGGKPEGARSIQRLQVTGRPDG